MHQFKKLGALALSFLLLTLPALGENLPSSQFGVNVWPYRNDTPCVPAEPTESPEATLAPTLQPTQKPTEKPASTPAVKPTDAPAADTNGNVWDYTTVSVSAQESLAWKLVNQDRISAGLSALPLDEELCAIARVKSQDMKANRYFAHTSPTYGDVREMLTYFGYSYHGAGENIAHHATVEKSQAAFMSSSGHRSNILGRQWTRMGVGICYDDQGFVYVTQIFAR